MFHQWIGVGTHLKQPGQCCAILIADADPAFRSQLGQALSLLGHDVSFADSGEKSLARLFSAPYDALLLSLETPGLDGLTILANARRLYPDLIIVVLTDSPTPESALAALQRNAAGYLCKPVSVGEAVAATVRALSTREWHSRERLLLEALSQAAEALFARPIPTPRRDPAASLVVGPLLLSLEERSIRLADVSDDAHLELTEVETGLIACLMATPGQSVSCVRIARRITGQDLDPWDAAAIVRPAVFRLRRKLTSQPNLAVSIRTVRGAGYRLCVQQVSAAGE